MTNWIKYKALLMELLGGPISVSSNTGEPEECVGMCSDCIFRGSCPEGEHYFIKFMEWMNKDDGTDNENKNEMTNMERYIDDIANNFALNKYTMDIIKCSDILCENCYLEREAPFAKKYDNKLGCKDLMKIWLQSPTSSYSEEEKKFLKMVDAGIIKKINGKCIYGSLDEEISIPLGGQFTFNIIQEGESMSIVDLKKKMQS